MKKILIFGGTREGRLLSELLAANQIEHGLSVATSYGTKVLLKNSYAKVWEGRKNEDEIKAVLKQEGYTLVIDATHPYAAEVTQNIKAACTGCGIEYLRLNRGIAEKDVDENRDVVKFADMESAAEYLNHTTGNILLTTGSKELSKVLSVLSEKERLYVRALPSQEVLQLCMEHGLPGKQLILMQGPFSREMNKVMLQEKKIRYLVSKESGNPGGFLEKVEAAGECGVTLVLLAPPKQEPGISFEELSHLLYNDILQ